MDTVTKSTHETYKVDLFAALIKSADGKYLAILSDDSVDRSDEIVSYDALKTIGDNFGYVAGLINHDNDAMGQVCKWINAQVVRLGVNNALVAQPHFFLSNPRAKILKDMLDEGAEHGISIGAIVHDYEDVKKKDGTSRRVYKKLELIEASFVGIPCNSHAKIIHVGKEYTLNENQTKALAIAKSFDWQKAIKSEVNTMNEEIKFAQKDLDLAVKKVEESHSANVAELSKAMDSLKSETETVKKALAEKEAALVASQELVKKLQGEVEAVKKQAFDKAQIALGALSETQTVAVEKAYKEGRLPVAVNR